MNIKRISEGLKRRLSAAAEFIKYYALYPFAVAAYGKRDIWLIAERGNDARDNGAYMFRYIRTNHPSIEAYYIITDDSADRKNVESYGDLVRYGSLKHYLLFIAAKVKISTHIMGFSPNRSFYTPMMKRLHMRGKTVFLQHGVIMDDIKQLYAEETNTDIFICGAKPEYDYISAHYHYKNNEVKYTGLARYDGLHDIKTKKRILIMPTWRKKLDSKLIHGQPVDDSEFIRRWNGVLNNEKIINAAEAAGADIVFYPHYELQKHLELFSTSGSNVIIADYEHYDVQQLLKEASLLITDFSSVLFDFAYMKKPAVYYQFDRDDFYDDHYPKGYFDHELMGFGEVVLSEEELADITVGYINGGFEMKPEYKNRTESFFLLNDCNNCERIFGEIVSLEKISGKDEQNI